MSSQPERSGAEGPAFSRTSIHKETFQSRPLLRQPPTKLSSRRKASRSRGICGRSSQSEVFTRPNFRLADNRQLLSKHELHDCAAQKRRDGESPGLGPHSRPRRAKVKGPAFHSLRKNSGPHRVPRSGTTVKAPAFRPVNQARCKEAFRPGRF